MTSWFIDSPPALPLQNDARKIWSLPDEPWLSPAMVNGAFKRVDHLVANQAAVELFNEALATVSAKVSAQ